MIRAWAAVLALAVAGPAPLWALSCIPYGVADAFLDAEAAPDGYVPVLGTLHFDPDDLPEVDWARQQDVPPETLLPATFAGEALTRRGVALPFKTDVVLEVRCAGPWCPAPRPGEILGFLRRTAHSYVLQTNACGGFLFTAPTPAQIDVVQDCLAGRACTRARNR